MTMIHCYNSEANGAIHGAIPGMVQDVPPDVYKAELRGTTTARKYLHRLIRKAEEQLKMDTFDDRERPKEDAAKSIA